jgi:hypothetical protein
MRYSLLPFQRFSNTTFDGGFPDIRDVLQSRPCVQTSENVTTLQLLDHVVDCLQNVPWKIAIDHCEADQGRLHLAVVATNLGRDLDVDDEVKAGFYLQHSEIGEMESLACSRLYRVKCSNGALIELDRGQSASISTTDLTSKWKNELSHVIQRSFDGPGVDTDLARFRATIDQMIVTPYELLCHLNAQGLIDVDEQCDIQEAFDQASDFSMYGFINAVTQVAHRLRKNDEWTRAFYFERLGGEILRGDHNLPCYDPAYL